MKLKQNIHGGRLQELNVFDHLISQKVRSFSEDILEIARSATLRNSIKLDM